MPNETPEERAHELHFELVETLKQLNRADFEETDVPGYEQSEIFGALRRGPCPGISDDELGQILATLIANGYAGKEEGPTYAWDRSRVLGTRYVITLAGKEYLVQQLEHEGRID